MKKAARFVVEVDSVSGLSTSGEVYLQTSSKEKTRVAKIDTTGKADLSGEVIVREATSRIGGFRSIFHRHSAAIFLPPPITISLRAPGDDTWFSNDITIGKVTLDFSKHTSDKDTPVSIPFVIPVSAASTFQPTSQLIALTRHCNLQMRGAAIVKPVLNARITCTWTPNIRQDVPAPAEEASTSAGTSQSQQHDTEEKGPVEAGTIPHY
jgi:hypothetical protein